MALPTPTLPPLPPPLGGQAPPPPPTRANIAAQPRSPQASANSVHDLGPGATRPPSNANGSVKLVALALTVLFVGGIGYAALQVGEFFGSTKMVGNLEEGDCLTDFFSSRNDEFIDVFLVSVTDCDNAHAMEVYGVTDSVFADDGFLYPGVDAAFDRGYEWCYDEFEWFVGERYETSPLEMWTFVPNEESWRQGDRGVTCLVGSFDEITKVTGTLRNSAGRSLT